MSNTEEIRLLEEEITLGAEAQNFVHSELGQRLADNLQELANEALNELKSVDPANIKKVTELQSKIWQAEHFMLWLIGVINDGKNAIEMVQQFADEEEPLEDE